MAFLKSKKALLLIPVLLLVLGGAFMLSPLSPMSQAEASQSSHGSSSAAKKTVAKEAAAPGPMYVMKERVVNVADTGTRRYLKFAMNIEMTKEAEQFEKAEGKERAKLQTEFEQSMAPFAAMIDDTVISILSAHNSADFATAEGKTALKTEIKNALNKVLGEGQVSNIYFTQFVTQ